MNYKRITLLAVHYGSGKTNVAVNMAFDLRKRTGNVVIADLDIVNPYFRTRDSEKELKEADIRLICSNYANTNLDVPAMPQEMYAITDDQSIHAVIDVGGDDRGALALGRLSRMILEENDYDLFLVVNRFRPLTPDPDSAVSVMKEVQEAARLPFTGIVHNSNLGAETTADDVRSSRSYAEEIAEKTGLPLVLTAVDERLFGELSGEIPDLFPLHLQTRPV